MLWISAHIFHSVLGHRCYQVIKWSTYETKGAEATKKKGCSRYCQGDANSRIILLRSNSFVFTKNLLYGRFTEYRQCNSLILHLNKSESLQSESVCGVLTSICLGPYLSAFVHKFRLKPTFQCWSCNNDALRLKIINRFARTPYLYSGTALFDLGFNWS